MAKIYYEKDASLDAIKDETIAVIGYGSQGRAQSLNYRDSGLKVILGLREGGKSWEIAKKEGFDVYPIPEAVERADIIQILIPDETQPAVYNAYIRDKLEEGNALGFSHGFNICFNQIVPPEFVDVIMVAPKAPGRMLRSTYEEGYGVPSLVAVKQDYTGRAMQRALAMAKALGTTRVGVIETTFEEETETDLFGEQMDLCGGVTEMIKASFEVLVEAGYQPEVCYFETLHELKLIVDLIYEGGLCHMWRNVSNTAEYGGLTRGKRIFNDDVKAMMRKTLEEIRSGAFAKEWVLENKANAPVLNSLRKKEEELLIEKIGKKLREMMQKPG
ncbi:MAG: ketol-acid reductoisomerase [Candidatus Hydrothermarchaeota archaeon]